MKGKSKQVWVRQVPIFFPLPLDCTVLANYRDPVAYLYFLTTVAPLLFLALVYSPGLAPSRFSENCYVLYPKQIFVYFLMMTGNKKQPLKK